MTTGLCRLLEAILTREKNNDIIKMGLERQAKMSYLDDFLKQQEAKSKKDLENKYGARYQQVRNAVMRNCQLEFSGKWDIHIANSTLSSLLAMNPSMSITTKFFQPQDSQKGYYNPRTNTISISDWSLEHCYSWELYEVIVHELLHANGYDHRNPAETRIMANELQRCMNILKKKSGVYGLPPFALFT